MEKGLVEAVGSLILCFPSFPCTGDTSLCWELELWTGSRGFNFKILLKYSAGLRVRPGWERGGNSCGSLNALLGFLGALSRSELVNLSLVGVFFLSLA